MNASMCRIAVTAITLLILTACSPMDFGSPNSDNHVNYREVGEPATFKSLTGVWEELLNSSGSSLDSSYVVIRDDGTYMKAVYNGEPLPNGQVGCYSIWESTIEQGSLGSGIFYIGENDFQVFTYENKMGYYEYEFTSNPLGGVNSFDSEYERSANSEAEFNFTPICQG